MINQLLHHFYYILVKPKDEQYVQNDYDPKYIAKLLKRREFNGKAFFYFKNKSNYIALFANGQINVRGEEGMFRPWGVSEFKNLTPQNLFERLESEIAKIKVPSLAEEAGHHFYSYSEFLDWLKEKEF